MQIRVFNYNTLERVHMFEAHSDYIRCIAVHPTQPYILTSSGMDRLHLHISIHITCMKINHMLYNILHYRLNVWCQ